LRCSSWPRGSSFYGGFNAPPRYVVRCWCGNVATDSTKVGSVAGPNGWAVARHVDPLDLQEPVVLRSGSVQWATANPGVGARVSVPRRRTPPPP
jgi:hypothetical protein